MRKGIEVRFGPGTVSGLRRSSAEGAAPIFRAAINRYLAETNKNPKPFIWTADPDAIIEKVRRGKEALSTFGVAR
jgi:hypothetical protein